jgi:hypothetical protein
MSETLRIEDGRYDLPIFIHSELDDLPLSSRAFRVYAHLARRAGRTNDAWPSYRSIGEKCFRKELPDSTSDTLRRMAMAAVEELVEAGLIRKIVNVDEEKVHKTNHYALTPRNEWTLGGGDNAPGGGDNAPRGDNAPKGSPIESTPTTTVATQPPAAQADPSPLPLAIQFNSLLEELRKSGNKQALLRDKVYVFCFGKEEDIPAYSRFGSVAKEIGGAGRLAEEMWKLSTKRPTGDILAYILGSHKNKGSAKWRNNHASSSQDSSTDDHDPDMEREWSAYFASQKANHSSGVQLPNL